MYQPFVKEPTYIAEKLEKLIESGEAKKHEFVPVRAARNDHNVSVFHDELTKWKFLQESLIVVCSYKLCIFLANSSTW